MAEGPGKYDDACTKVREETGGEVLLIVINGKKGHGFAAQTSRVTQMRLPDILEGMARDIRKGHISSS